MDGIPFFEGVLIGHVTKRGELVNISSHFLPHVERASGLDQSSRLRLESAPAISSTRALVSAVTDIGAAFAPDAITGASDVAATPEKRQTFQAIPLLGDAQSAQPAIAPRVSEPPTAAGRADAVRSWLRLARPAAYRSRRFARLNGLSLRQLERRLRQTMGLSPRRFLAIARMQAAFRLVVRGTRVKAVAGELGFEHPSNFIRHFKRVHRRTPIQFTRKVGGGAPDRSTVRQSGRSVFSRFRCPCRGTALGTGGCLAQLGASNL